MGGLRGPCRIVAAPACVNPERSFDEAPSTSVPHRIGRASTLVGALGLPPRMIQFSLLKAGETLPQIVRDGRGASGFEGIDA